MKPDASPFDDAVQDGPQASAAGPVEDSPPNALAALRGPLWKTGISAGLLAGLALFTWLAQRTAEFQAEDIGLGRNTFPTTAHDDGRQISGPIEDLELLRETFRELELAGRPVILWIGASQLYALNQPEEGDHLAVWYATQAARARGSEYAYVMAANPNCNQTELYATYLSFRQHGLIPDVLVVGFTYDDLKEPGVRMLMLDDLRPLDAAELALGGEGAANIEAARLELAQGLETAAPVERNAVGGTPQEALEEALVTALEARWPAYAERGKLQAAATAWWKLPFTALVYKVFSPPKRLVPPEQELWNEAGLTALLETAAADGVPTFVYKAPHRPIQDGASFYHDRRAYDAYHADLEARLEQRKIPYIDLELIVAREFWGTANDGSPDVFHFRDEGHRLLGAAIDGWLAEQGY